MSQYKDKSPADALKHLYSGDNNDSPTGDQIDEIWRRAARDLGGRAEIHAMAEDDPTTVVDILIRLLSIATVVAIAVNF